MFDGSGRGMPSDQGLGFRGQGGRLTSPQHIRLARAAVIFYSAQHGTTPNLAGRCLHTRLLWAETTCSFRLAMVFFISVLGPCFPVLYMFFENPKRGRTRPESLGLLIVS